jgi:hypothetical protein
MDKTLIRKSMLQIAQTEIIMFLESKLPGPQLQPQ